jgi:hypothetical protein
MSVNRLLIIILSFLTLAFPTLAVAHEFTPGTLLENGKYAVNQNADGTWTEWLGGNIPGTPIEGTTYTSAEMDEAMGNAGYTVDKLGGYSVSSADIVGGNMKEFEAGKALYKNLADGQLYMDVSSSEAQIGRWATATARLEGVLPTLTRGLSFMGDVGLAVGAFGLGVEIGNGIDEIFGLGQLGLGGGGTEVPTLPEPTEVLLGATGGYEVEGVCKNSSNELDPNGGERISSSGTGNWPTYSGTTEVCMAATPYFDYQQCESSGGEIIKFHCPTVTGSPKHFTGPGTSKAPMEGEALVRIYHGQAQLCGQPYGVVLMICYHETGVQGSVSMAEEMMPQALAEPPTGFVKAPQETAPSRPAPAHFPPPVPASVPASVKVFVLEPEPGKEGKKLPSPLLPEIPHALPNETGTKYKERLNTEGWPNVEVHTLPETAIDPNVGPEGVSYTAPAEGTHESTKTIHVDVEQNPTNAPIPAETPNKIGPPTEPGFKLPKFGVLCKGFPFGVPCWLVKTIEGWSATPKAPEWGLEEFSIKGKKVSGSKFHLSQLEPIMEKVRPAILIFVTIGIVLLFYKFAKGGGPEGGSGSGVDTTETYYDGPNEYRVS